MAPEFIPLVGSYVAFVALAASALLMLLVGVGLLIWARYGTARCKGLRLASALAFFAALPLTAGMLFFGIHIRQEYFLNEPLVSACTNGDLAQARQLLERGASPNAWNHEAKLTALMCAARNGRRDTVALLLHYGANIRLRDSEGRTASEQAKSKGHDEIATMIEQFQRSN